MFQDRSHLLPPRSFAKLVGATVADLDGDGQFEIFLAAANGPNRLLKWTVTGLRDVAPPVLADVDRDGRVAVAADCDGDGREELYLLNEGSDADRLFDPRPDGWSDLLAAPGSRAARGPHPGRAVAAFDRRGHGRYAFVLATNDGPLRLLECPDAGGIADLAPALGIDRPVAGAGIALAPLASPRCDLFLAAARGSNALFRNTGLGTFLEVAVEHGLADAAELSVAATVVDDGDGASGLAVLNADGPHRLFLRRDDGIYRDAATPAMALPGDARFAVVADFDNDGFEELLVFHRGEANRFFRRTDTGWSVIDPGPLAAEPGACAAAILDIDRDGILELVSANGTAAPTLWKGIANGNAWLRVRPLTRFGAPARGAIVRLLAGGRRQQRVVCCGNGSTGQMEPVAHFGLGSCERIDHVQVTWPDGTLARIEAPAACTTIDLRYPGT